VLHFVLLSLNSLNQTQNTVFTFLLHLLLLEDRITRTDLPNYVAASIHLRITEHVDVFSLGFTCLLCEPLSRLPDYKKYLFFRNLGKHIYNKYYNGVENIPYMWMPKWSDSKDPSNRSINI